MKGTLALSWGPWGGFYVHRRRICLGWVALTYLPRVEVDDLMAAYADAAAFRDTLESIRTYSHLDGDKTHQRYVEACGVDLCVMCLINGTADSALKAAAREALAA